MKHIRNIAFVIILIQILIGCQKMEDVHGKYIKDGELIYAPKPMMMHSFAGEGRIKIKFYLYNAINVNKCLVKWEGNEFEKEFTINPELPLDSIELLIDSLEEKSYLFYVNTVDVNENVSVRIPVNGSSYGDIYASTLVNRNLTSINGGGMADSVVLNWGAAQAGNIGVQMMYNDSLGVKIKKLLEPTNSVVTLYNWERGGSLKYTSLYVPEPLAIDTFITNEITIQLPQ